MSGARAGYLPVTIGVDRGGSREHRGVAVDEAGDLQTERQAFVLQHRQRDRRDRRAATRARCRPDRRSDRSPSGAAAGAERLMQTSHSPASRRIDRADLLARLEVGAIVVERHRLGFGEPVEHDAAELARVAVAIGVERPAALPGVDPYRQRPRLRDRRFGRFDLARCRRASGPRCRRPSVARCVSSIAALAPGEAAAQPAVSMKATRLGFCAAGTLAGP